MATRHLAALAIAAAFIPTPAGASDIANYEGPGMKFYYRIPLDAGRGKESMPAFGRYAMKSRSPLLCWKPVLRPDRGMKPSGQLPSSGPSMV